MSTKTKKKTVRGATKMCTKVVAATGLKRDGTLKKGYKYVAGGKIVKTAAPKKATAKKATPKKKKTAKAKK